MSKNHKARRLQRKAVSYFLSFIIYVLTTVLILYSCVAFCVFRPNMYIKALDKTKYSEAALKEFELSAWDITIPTGMPKSTVENLVNENRVKSDIISNVKAELAGEEYKPDVQDIKTLVVERVEKYFSDNNKEMSEEQRTALTEYTATISDKYTSSVQLKVLKYLGSISTMYNTYILIYAIAFMIINIIAILVLYKVQKFKHKFFRYLSYSQTAVAFTVIAFPIMDYINKYSERVNVNPEYFKAFLIKYMRYLELYLIIAAVIVGIIVILLGFGINYTRNKIKKYKHN